MIKQLNDQNVLRYFNKGLSSKNMPSPRAYMKSRRKRRLKTEIERNYRCVVPGCPKAYGSENSLN